jgi:hypothetical protein
MIPNVVLVVDPVPHEIGRIHLAAVLLATSAHGAVPAPVLQNSVALSFGGKLAKST